MSAVDLLQPILDGGLERNNFFNGRLLSAEDLRAEQTATAAQLARLAGGVGDGVAWGMGVSVLTSSRPRPTVLIRHGLAVNRLGNLLSLADDAEVALVPATSPADAALGLFVECEPPATSGSLSGTGAYVLVVAPSSGYRGTALVSDPNTTVAGRGSCGARFTVEGVRFRLVPIPLADLAGIGDALRARIIGLLPPADAAARERVRNLLAHCCFGTQALGFADPAQLVAVKPVLPTWGALDAMRDRRDLTDCDVPLAVVVLTGDGISFVDMWPARRKLVDQAAIEAWRGIAGPRRIAEGEAAFLQFQAQLENVNREASPGSIAASSYFDVLPAGGWLPTGTGGFNWSTFLGPHAPPAVTPVDAALLRGILERSWFDEPFALATTPPVPVRVYAVPEQATGGSFVVFARSSNGNIRVFLNPPPATGQSVEVTATADTGAMTRATTRTGNLVPLPELVPGPHQVSVTAPDYVAIAPQAATVVGGRTVDLSVTLTPLPNGSILVEPIDKRTGENIGRRVTNLSASDGVHVFNGSFQASSAKWLIDDLPPATYSLIAAAPHYQIATKNGVGPTRRGETIDTQLIFEPESRDAKQPSRCVGIKEMARPRLNRIRICLVLTATEFEESFLFRDEKGRPRARSTSEKMRIEGRGEDAKSRQRDRYVADTGEIVYNRALWERMVPLESPPPEVREWLQQWRDWFAVELDDKAILGSSPVLYFDPEFSLARNAKEVRDTPPGYAVFRRFGVPFAIVPEDQKTKAPAAIRKEDLPGIREEVVKKLYDAEIRTIDDLAWGWRELVTDATAEPPETVRYLISDAATAATEINSSRTYLPGVDKATDKALRDLGINDDVALANADLDKLGDKLGSRGFAIRLVDAARNIVTPQSWSLAGLGLADNQIAALTERGIDSKGAFAAHAARADGKAAIAEATGLDAESAVTRDAAVAAIANEAVSVMTRSSLEVASQPMLTTWANVDSLTAAKLTKAGLVSVEDLAGAKPEDVATAANLPLNAAQKLVEDAQGASRTSMTVGTLAPVSRAEEKGLKELLHSETVTVGEIANKTPDEIAAAFGGNVARATALLNGIKAGLVTRGIR